jgi:hypothetical protein
MPLKGFLMLHTEERPQSLPPAGTGGVSRSTHDLDAS